MLFSLGILGVWFGFVFWGQHVPGVFRQEREACVQVRLRSARYCRSLAEAGSFAQHPSTGDHIR